ncbi:PcfJ domain-containing protein [Hahella ganghwensis]|uniref:PcfJ domain-containing protein n=1 Tax=Hahella ganghwensis TaxID=286420 RepID=UPI0003760734|nr:PcfJ domain-containing protein [Hahella ganghwensis]
MTVQLSDLTQVALNCGSTPKWIPESHEIRDLQISVRLEEPEASSFVGKLRKNAFGREDLAECYRTAKDIIIRHNLFRICQYEEHDETRILTICNLWRIERMPDSSLLTFEYCLKSGLWLEVEKLEGWPRVPFYPIKNTQSLDWWRSIVRQVIWKALSAAGFFSLKNYPEEKTWTLDSAGNPIPAPRSRKTMSPNKMAYFLIKHYIGEQGAFNKKKKEFDWIPGWLDPESAKNGARSLRGAFFNYILDHEVLSAMLAIDYRDTCFLSYLRYARFRSGLLKVSTERRNLLPLLPGINPEQWGRNDLLSRNLWVKDGRKTTPLDRSPVRIQNGKGANRRIPTHYQSFEVAAAWRWLSNASSVIVREWAGRKDNTIITNIALANICSKAPVYAYVQIIRLARRLQRYGVSERMQLLLRLFFDYSAKLWKKKGYTAVRIWLRDSSHSTFRDLLDYLEAEGFEEGVLNKRSTWKALIRRSDDWHQRIAIQRMEDALSGLTVLKWGSLINETMIDKVLFVPLNCSKSLAVEGYELDHCVGDYAELCYQGRYRVFSVQEPDGKRSTLGIEIEQSKASWDQHECKYREQPSVKALQAGYKLVEAYQNALNKKVR